ncbi:glycosyltransferase family 4 protein [Rosenbergiella collisarenosi]|uniref:glycosyltransferase family 4 protein n=4 Tax=Rosenbergiella collisarenosi TaxID=1544695 RepID=UPI001BDA0035|nr:glycosyltransferase family 4 protein [Rosenbergiella collisarenosi]MBT0719872.1 glycosyltransferase family 4 protein [Rosenbergiella collisarenosi]
MKKICYFINSDWYFDLHWLERAYAAQQDGFQVHVVTRYNSDDFVKKFTDIGFTCHHIVLKERSINPFGFLYGMFNTIILLHKIGPDILHSITIKPIIIGGIYSRFFKKNFITNIVGLGRVFDNGGIIFKSIRFLVTRFYKFIFKNPKSKIIFEHDNDRFLLGNFLNLNSTQTTVIDGAGVDTNFFAYQQEEHSKVPVVFFAARMLKNKGLDTLVEIKRELAKENIKFQLIVAGIEVPDDPQAISHTTIKNWEEQGDIIWLGTRKDMSELITQSNIVALPTTYPEGVPRILIEACAIGRACIAYDSGGCGSIVVDGVNGFLVKKDNKKEFKDKILKLILDVDLRIAMGIQGRKIVAERFSSQDIIAKTLDIYKSLER